VGSEMCIRDSNGLVNRRADEESVCLGRLEVKTLVQNEVGK
jgi:hypothetical protein